MNILLLNPPGKKLYVRDYYCSKVSKARYSYEPLDLLMLSGILSTQHRISVLDAITRHTSPSDCLKEIKAINPQVVISLTGAVSFYEDVEFWKSIKLECPDMLIFASGDILMEESESFLHNLECLDGILTDFTSNSILHLLEDRSQPYADIIHRHNGKILKSSETPAGGEFQIPVPRHELFPLKQYLYPFIATYPFATVLTDYGCPYHCSFCIMGTLAYKWRAIENVIEELKYLQKLGIKEIYFSDQTFGALGKRRMKLCQRFIEERLGLSWCCFSRVDMVTEESLKLMKEAGCHTIMFGVESGNDEILKRYQKNISRTQAIKALSLSKRLGFRTCATFIIGLPEDTEATILETIQFAKDIEPDYVSFNIYVPRMHTTLRKTVLTKGLVSEDVRLMDQSGTFCVTGTTYLSSREVLALQKKAIKEFYLRPNYLIKRIKEIKSLFHLKRELLGGMDVIRDAFRSFKYRL